MASYPRWIHTFSPSVFRSALSGSAPGLGGCSYQMLKICLDDAEILQLLREAAEDFARAAVPQCIFHVFCEATLTALMKRDVGIRGIATSTSFRRLVSKSLARQFMKDVEDVCSPFQFALSTRAGTDCVVHAVRALTDLNPDAYDHVFGSAMLAKLHDEPRLHGLLPFVRALYSERSCYWWRDSEGVQHPIW